MSARMLSLALAALVLAACSNRMSDLRQYVAEVKARKVTQIPPVPKIVAYRPFAYVADHRRDPFQPQEGAPPPLAAGTGAVHPDMNRPKQPLEAFPLDALSMVGEITYKGVTYAMIKAPDGVIYRVTVGDYMGQNYGKVTRITGQQVDLTELVPNGFGGWEQRPAVVSLADKGQ